MIDRIKGLMGVREEVDALRQGLDELKDAVKQLTEEYKGEADRVHELHNTQGDLLAKFLQSTQSLSRLKEEIRKEIDDFRMLNRQAQSKMMDRFEQEISNSLTHHSKTLEVDKAQYDKMKSEIQKNSELLTQLNTEMSRLVLITQRIKAQDFELTEHHKRLLEADHQKIALLKRIDELEHMIGRFKQSRGPY